jgi:two-component system response regulator QseB
VRVLIIEDDPLIGEGLCLGLAKLGFCADLFADGGEGAEALYTAPYDAVVLDLGLPGRGGLSILREWRDRKRSEPVLILSARADMEQKVLGLDSRADDYLGKPFALAEVAARLKALVRRAHGRPGRELSFGNIRFDQAARVAYLGDEPIDLPPMPLKLLELFLLSPGVCLGKGVLEEKLHAWGDEVQSNAVEVHVSRLRKKLGPGHIRTVHKIGYVLEKPENTENPENPENRD